MRATVDGRPYGLESSSRGGSFLPPRADLKVGPYEEEHQPPVSYRL